MNLTLIDFTLVSNADSPETFSRLEPVSITDMQTHGRLPTLLIPPGDDPEYIKGLIGSAREQVEEDECGGIQLLTASYELSLDCFPAGNAIRISRPPLQELLSVKYTNANGDEQTLYDSVDSSPTVDLGIFKVDGLARYGKPRPAELYLASGQSWPATLDERNVVRIRFTCGFGDAVSDIPRAIRQWIMIAAGTMYEQRENILSGSVVQDMKFVSGLLDPWRIEKTIA